jgi:hypothetical protein
VGGRRRPGGAAALLPVCVRPRPRRPRRSPRAAAAAARPRGFQGLRVGCMVGRRPGRARERFEGRGPGGGWRCRSRDAVGHDRGGAPPSPALAARVQATALDCGPPSVGGGYGSGGRGGAPVGALGAAGGVPLVGSLAVRAAAGAAPAPPRRPPPARGRERVVAPMAARRAGPTRARRPRHPRPVRAAGSRGPRSSPPTRQCGFRGLGLFGALLWGGMRAVPRGWGV